MPNASSRTQSREDVPGDGSIPTLIPSNALFITRLIDVTNAGGGLVPFVGSGCSAQSGIIMGQQFDEYLAYAVFLCVADEESIEAAGANHSGRWDLRRNGWPKQPTPSQANKARSWVKQQFVRICKDNGFKVHPPTGNRIETMETEELEFKPEGLAKALSCPLLPRILRASKCTVNQDELRRLHPFFGQHGLVRGGYSVPGLSPTSFDAIEERAIRSLHDWRATLHFLSELKLIGRGTLLVEPPDPAIIDSFNVHITAGRKPNLMQNMLCHLAGPARFRTIITTNFDTLIEDAFQEMKEKLAVISVSIKGSLPDPGIVHARNTVVKLHGTLWETRADFSLDESPSLENKRRFFHYVRGEYPDNLTESAFLPGQLFVCGYSGSDNRSVEMIKYVLDASPDAQLYWVCHNDADFQKLKTLFRERWYNDRIFATITERSDLLLYELYQRLRLSLPRGGFSYQYTHNVPPDASDPKHESKQSAAEGVEILRSTQWFCNPAADGGHTSKRLLIVTGFPGVLAALREVGDRLTKEYEVSQIWLELEDYRDTFSLAYELLLLLSIRLGLFQLSHADLVPAGLIDRCDPSRERRGGSGERVDADVTSEWIKHLRLLLGEYFNIVPGKWLIILYGRNGPGGCAGWAEGEFWGRNDPDKEYGSVDKVGRFAPFVKALCAVGFHVAYAPYGQDRSRQDKEKPAQLQNVLGTHITADVSMGLNAIEYTPPPPHQNKVMNISFAPSDEFKGVVRRSFPKVDVARSKVVDFNRCMTGVCKHWIMRSTRSAKARIGQPPLLENLRLLYGASLFRQSRHYSAFLGEAVMHCPYRFNAVGRDNDWIRSKLVESRLESLRAIGLFYEKPGGFAWTYWDFRLGLRRMITSLPSSYLRRKGKNKKPLEPLHTWRSHYHYWISDWYMRAFYTTGHATPLMEAVYHLYQAIIYMGELRAQSKFDDIELAWRRYRWWRIAVCDMTKALRIGRDAIRLWFGPAKFQEWFGEREGASVVAQLRSTCEDILAPLDERKVLRTHAESIILVLSEELRQLMLLGSERGRIKGSVPAAPDRVQRLDADWSYLSELNESSIESKSPYVWEGAAPAPISALCNAVCESLQKYPNDSARINRRLAPWLKEQFQTDSSDRHFFYLVQQLNEWAFILVRRAKLQQLINRYERGETRQGEPRGPLLCLEKTTKHLWTVATILTNTAIELCRAIHPMLDTFEQKERVRALCLYGLALGRLGRFYEAHRRLNEANALLSKIAVPTSSVLLGILKIRRGEVHLLEAMLLADLAQIKDWRALNREHLNERYGTHCSATTCTEADEVRLFRLRIAKLDDAWCSLESAEHLLAGKLHSSRWWARLCVLKLRCLAEQPDMPRHPLGGGEKQTAYRLIARRQQSEPFEQIWELFSNGVASSLGHPRLRLRLVDFALRAALRIDLGSPPARAKRLVQLKSLADTCLSTELGPQTSLRRIYAGKINELLTESVKRARTEAVGWQASASSG